MLVVGGSGGIGWGAATALMQAGARVTILSRSAPPTGASGSDGEWEAGRSWLPADLRQGREVAEALDAWLRREHGRVDVLLLCAGSYGAQERHQLSATSQEEWDEVAEVNVRGPFLVLRALLPALLRRPRALIADVRSDVAYGPGPGRVAYSASKWAARGLMEGLAAELEGTAVSVVGLLPARQVATPGLARRRPAGFDFAGYLSPLDFGRAIVPLVASLGEGFHGSCMRVE